jgi:tryptophan synthase alpha chain
MPESGLERIAGAFESSGKRAALMPYLMGGYPDIDGSLALGESLVGAGADVIELGVPFSDPLADGPVIQAAGEQALRAGATFDRVIDEVGAPLAGRVPVVVMCYANPLMIRGADAVSARIAAAGIAGLIVPDLPFDEAGALREACDRHGIALVPLAAPTTPAERIRQTAAAARGFVYVVSVTGVTGERGQLPPELEAVVQRVRAAADVPVAVGFGIATSEQVSQVGAIADGVIIGSRLVRAVAAGETIGEGVAEAAAFLSEADRALR